MPPMLVRPAAEHPVGDPAVRAAIGLSAGDRETLRAADLAHQALLRGDKFEPAGPGSQRSRRLLWTVLIDRYQHRPDLVERRVAGQWPDEDFRLRLYDWVARPDGEGGVDDTGPQAAPKTNWHVLVGASGAGKTTAGRLYATRTGQPFIDLDAVVESALQTSLAKLFANLGSLGTLRQYAAVVDRWMTGIDPAERAVVAFGAGAVLMPSLRAVLTAAPASTWIAAPAETLTARIAADRHHAAHGHADQGHVALHAFVQLGRSPLYASARRSIVSRGTAADVADVLWSLERESA